MDPEELKFEVSQSIDIRAGVDDVFQVMLRRMGEDSTSWDGKSMPMVLEAWPGGRWFRDLSDGQGHWWGFVQVIKRPILLEIAGPLFMSYPVAGHLSLRLTSTSDGTHLDLRHQVLGFVKDGHCRGVVPGWRHLLTTIRECSEQ